MPSDCTDGSRVDWAKTQEATGELIIIPQRAKSIFDMLGVRSGRLSGLGQVGFFLSGGDSSRIVLKPISQLNQTIFKAFNGLQLQRYMPVPTRN